MNTGVFTEIKAHTDIEEAFSLYPQDWKDVLLPVWPLYAENARVYALLDEKSIVTLGILFYGNAPEMQAFPEMSARLFKEGKPYIGFLYTLPEYRGRGYASLWLTELKNRIPGSAFWLTVEDPGLIPFYEANGFILSGKSTHQEEWLLLFRP